MTVEQMKRAIERELRMEFLTDTIERWHSGAMATPGCPAGGITYAVRMRAALPRLEEELRQLRAEARSDQTASEHRSRHPGSAQESAT